MYRSRQNRWSCSKFADFIRGTTKPFALGGKEWDEWHTKTRKKNPVRYYLAENVLNTIQDVLYFPYDVYRNIKFYVRNRWIDRTHLLNTGFKPGQYYEFDNKILHGLFNEFVIFLETEYASLSKYNSDKKYVFKNGRSKEAALDYLDWASGLTYGEDYGINTDDPDYNKPTPQAESSKTMKELYLWWTITRPQRVDPYSLYDSYYPDSEQYGIGSLVDAMEKANDAEDTLMMIKLVSIRQSIWC